MVWEETLGRFSLGWVTQPEPTVAFLCGPCMWRVLVVLTGSCWAFSNEIIFLFFMPQG